MAGRFLPRTQQKQAALPESRLWLEYRVGKQPTMTTCYPEYCLVMKSSSIVIVGSSFCFCVKGWEMTKRGEFKAAG